MPRHRETRIVPYQPEQMFDLVADVGAYPQFLPWCIGARVRNASETENISDLTIGFGPFRESFTSRVAMQRPGLIQVRYQNGPFKYLNNEWKFTPDPAGCRIDFWVDFEFRSRILQLAIGAVFQEAVHRMVSAFLTRARAIHGPAAAARPASIAAKRA